MLTCRPQVLCSLPLTPAADLAESSDPPSSPGAGRRSAQTPAMPSQLQGRHVGLVQLLNTDLRCPATLRMGQQQHAQDNVCSLTTTHSLTCELCRRTVKTWGCGCGAGLWTISPWHANPTWECASKETVGTWSQLRSTGASTYAQQNVPSSDAFHELNDSPVGLPAAAAATLCPCKPSIALNICSTGRLATSLRLSILLSSSCWVDTSSGPTPCTGSSSTADGSSAYRCHQHASLLTPRARADGAVPLIGHAVDINDLKIPKQLPTKGCCWHLCK